MQRTSEELAAAMYGTPAPATAQPAQASAQGGTETPGTQRTSAELAAALYGAPAAPEQAAATEETGGNEEEQTKPRTQEELAAAMYGPKDDGEPLDPVPEEVAALRDDPLRRMYPAQVSLQEAIPDQLFTSAEGVDAQAGRKVARELREMAADLTLGRGEVQTLRSRAAFVHEHKPDPAAQREAAVEALNREFGNGAKQALRDARALLQRDPRTAKIIEAMGVGDDPQVVLMIARAARQQRVAGKFKGARHE